MKHKLKTVLKCICISLIIILGICITVFFGKYEVQKHQIQENIEYIYNIYNNDNLQENFDKYITETNIEPGVEIEVEEGIVQNALGVLEIPKIDFKDIVLEGTTQDVLANGIGLFEHSQIFNGNVCLAGHNNSRFFKRLNELDIGDKINYISCLGKREYAVSDIQIISETDWSMLESTNDNRLTIITCIRNQPEVRLCVQAIEIN